MSQFGSLLFSLLSLSFLYPLASALKGFRLVGLESRAPAVRGSLEKGLLGKGPEIDKGLEQTTDSSFLLQSSFHSLEAMTFVPSGLQDLCRSQSWVCAHRCPEVWGSSPNSAPVFPTQASHHLLHPPGLRSSCFQSRLSPDPISLLSACWVNSEPHNTMSLNWKVWG